jgi:hypothetical protein
MASYHNVMHIFFLNKFFPPTIQSLESSLAKKNIEFKEITAKRYYYNNGNNNCEV